MFIVVLSFIAGKTGVPDSAAKNGYFIEIRLYPVEISLRKEIEQLK